jgi:hypothetical protein
MISDTVSPANIPGIEPWTPLDVCPGMKEEAFVIDSQYVILPLLGITTTSPGSPPADRAANAAIGSGSLADVGEKGNLKEKMSLDAGDDEDEL